MWKAVGRARSRERAKKRALKKSTAHASDDDSVDSLSAGEAEEEEEDEDDFFPAPPELSPRRALTSFPDDDRIWSSTAADKAAAEAAGEIYMGSTKTSTSRASMIAADQFTPSTPDKSLIATKPGSPKGAAAAAAAATGNAVPPQKKPTVIAFGRRASVSFSKTEHPDLPPAKAEQQTNTKAKGRKVKPTIPPDPFVVIGQAAKVHFTVSV